MRLGQLIEYNKRNIFFKHYVENEAGRQSPDLFLFLKTVQYQVKPSRLQLSFNVFRYP